MGVPLCALCVSVVKFPPFDRLERSQLQCGLFRNEQMNNPSRIVPLALLSSFLLFSCAGAPRTNQNAYRSFRLGLIPGAQSFVDFVMQRQRILNQFGLQSEKLELLSPA